MNNKLLPIFYDRTGKRSYAVYFIMIAVVISFIVAAAITVPPILAPEQALNNQAPADSDAATVRKVDAGIKYI